MDKKRLDRRDRKMRERYELIDCLIDCVEQANDPDTFMKLLNNYKP